MRLIGLAVVLAVGFVLAPLAIGAQPAEKVYRVGTLGIKASDPAEGRYWQGFRLGLRERGWMNAETLCWSLHCLDRGPLSTFAKNRGECS